MGLKRKAGFLYAVIGEPDPGKLPACLRGKKVSVAGADVRLRRGAGTAAQHHLAAHEFAVVFAQSSGRGLETGIGKVGAGGPFPDVAKNLEQTISFGGGSDRGMKSPTLQQVAFDGDPA